MASHAEILQQPERLAGPFWTSLILHLAVVGGISAGAWAGNQAHLNMGSLTGGGFGSVAVNPVASIPLPNRGGPENPVANNTESQVPAPPKTASKPAPKAKVPSPDAIALKGGKVPKRPMEAAAQPNKFAERQPYSPSQLYSDAGQRVSSTLFEKRGAGGVGIGDASPFGDRFGEYATRIRDLVANRWSVSDINSRITAAPPLVVTFTIRKDGSVANVRVAQSSGIAPLDFSAQRAVEDAQLPPLPAGFPRDHADVELRFELRR